MLPLTGYFKGMFGRIKPSQERLDLAQSLPDTVRDHIVASEKITTVEDDPRTHLAGSYARYTGVDDVKDVDVLVFVDPTYEQQDPEVVLDDLAAALEDLHVDGYGKGEVKTDRKNRRSHHVEFSKDGEKAFHVDVVPVVRFGNDKTAKLRIPDRDWESWDDTQPIGYAERLTTLNERHDKKVRRTVRMMKRIRNYQMESTRRPKSYWLEALVYNLWNEGRFSGSSSYADLMYDLLKTIRARCGSTPLRISDPCLGRNLTDSWEQAEYDEFVEMLGRVIGYLDPIANEADADAAVAAWRKVFGAVFELSEEAKQTSATAKAVASGATVTKAGTVVPTTAGVAGVVAPSHRFYGDR